MIHYPVWAIVLFAFQVLHTIYTPKMVEKYENNEFKFGFCFKRWVVAHNVGLLVSLFVCYLLVYGNMGMWYVWEYGNVRTTVPIFLQQQNLFFQLISMCLHRPCLIHIQIKLFLLLDNLLRPALWPYQYWGHRKYQKSRGRTVCLLYWDKNFYFCYNNHFSHCYFLSSFQMQG